nr:hypothetical protein Iba_chr01bCG3240 [Ipomoea batatas]
MSEWQEEKQVIIYRRGRKSRSHMYSSVMMPACFGNRQRKLRDKMQMVLNIGDEVRWRIVLLDETMTVAL